MLDKLSYVHEMQESENHQVTGQVARKSSQPKLYRPKPESRPRNFNKECM